MIKFVHTLISGIVWIFIATGVGILGSWLTTLSGVWPFLGWPLAIIGFGFAGMSALHLWRITNLQMQGMRMMRDDPEGFKEARRRYEDAMRRIDGGSKNDPADDKLIPLLNGIVQPLQQGATQQIENAAQYIRDGDSQGRFMLLMMHVCLASILYRLDRSPQSKLSSSFKDFAISQWDRPPSMTIQSVHKLFAYSQQQLGDTLVNPDDDELEDVGLTLLSIVVPDQEHFTTEAALAAGQAAHVCWQQASSLTQAVMES